MRCLRRSSCVWEYIRAAVTWKQPPTATWTPPTKTQAICLDENRRPVHVIREGNPAKASRSRTKPIPEPGRRRYQNRPQLPLLQERTTPATQRRRLVNPVCGENKAHGRGLSKSTVPITRDGDSIVCERQGRRISSKPVRLERESTPIVNVRLLYAIRLC